MLQSNQMPSPAQTVSKFLYSGVQRVGDRWLSQLLSTWVNTGSLETCVFYSIQFASSTATYW